MRSTEAACLTCRQKSRRCDRARPMCKRCISRGLQCGGYPDKFRFCGIASRGKWKNRDAPTDQGAASISSTSTPEKRIETDQGCPLPNDGLGEPLTSQRSTPHDESEIHRILALAETETLMTA
ncbi:fungal-specific transcription factor domain-containing protein [Penicillium canariense]|uniref:Fungal-specific transcription factor domain-containing protein n=1 Tax=Penicillium canariense TaxID=189055 RepID=A0A9W9I4W9_9EURO|nr:fungal-specific transcription factor domain-containing protein [Penicillium canariense]KAJ5166699.1 fungal-specific transcription factor domain-containing protein [Penicillium canariense]